MKIASVEIPHFNEGDLCPSSPLFWGFYTALLLLYDNYMEKYFKNTVIYQFMWFAYLYPDWNIQDQWSLAPGGAIQLPQ